MSLLGGNGSLNRNAHFSFYFFNAVHRDINQSLARVKSQTSSWLKLTAHAGFIRVQDSSRLPKLEYKDEARRQGTLRRNGGSIDSPLWKFKLKPASDGKWFRMVLTDQ